MVTDSDRSGFLIRLFHHRWTVSVAVEIARRDGSRFVELQRGLGISPASLRPAIRTLFELGLATRNPGYGHPLRPEYLPTSHCRRIAPALNALLRLGRDLAIQDLIMLKWPLPVLYAADRGAHRFSELQGLLTGITPRALAQALRSLTVSGLLHRRVQVTFPPIPVYQLSAPGRRAVRVIHRIVA